MVLPYRHETRRHNSIPRRVSPTFDEFARQMQKNLSKELNQPLSFPQVTDIMVRKMKTLEQQSKKRKQKDFYNSLDLLG